MPDAFQAVIDGLKKEVERLEKIAARFEKSNSMHHESVIKVICSIEQNIRMMESAPGESSAKPERG